MLDWLADPNAWIALATLTALEIVLGIDNIIFISILVGRVPAARRDLARRLGLGLAMGTRIALLLSLSWIMQLREPLFTLFQKFSGRDLILIGTYSSIYISSAIALDLGLKPEHVFPVVKSREADSLP